MPINQAIEQLQQLLLRVRSQLDQADAHISVVNEVIASIASLQLVSDRTFLGHVVHSKDYAPRFQPADSGIVLQAALNIPQGLGIAAWDSDTFAELRQASDGLEWNRGSTFVPYHELEPAIRALLLPQVESLLLRLIQLAAPFGRLP